MRCKGDDLVKICIVRRILEVNRWFKIVRPVRSSVAHQAVLIRTWLFLETWSQSNPNPKFSTSKTRIKWTTTPQPPPSKRTSKKKTCLNLQTNWNLSNTKFKWNTLMVKETSIFKISMLKIKFLLSLKTTKVNNNCSIVLFWLMTIRIRLKIMSSKWVLLVISCSRIKQIAISMVCSNLIS